MTQRFQDQEYTLSHFQTKVDVVCPNCAKKAFAEVDYKKHLARINCVNCGFSKEVNTDINLSGFSANILKSANAYFGAELWFSMPFKDEIFWAFNLEHLDYLEAYISAKLREHKDRKHFTLLEKLPRFYHEAKNRDALLKIILKLKRKK